MDVNQFKQKWIVASSQKESAAAQSHFHDLCALLNAPTPTEADPTGETYTFEKGATKAGGGDGYADVWYRGHFAIEYKGHKKDLNKAYQQVIKYKDALENPPLLVVCDLIDASCMSFYRTCVRRCIYTRYDVRVGDEAT